MTTLLGTFEEQIEPLLPADPETKRAIKDFKRVCREKINRLAYEGIRAARSQPADHVSDLAADLAEHLAFHDTEASEP